MFLYIHYPKFCLVWGGPYSPHSPRGGMRADLKALSAATNNPDIWIDQVEWLLKNGKYLDAINKKFFHVEHNKLYPWFMIPSKRFHYYINHCIVMDIASDCNLLLDYLDYAVKNNKREYENRAKTRIFGYSEFLFEQCRSKDPFVKYKIQKDDERFKVGLCGKLYMQKGEG